MTTRFDAEDEWLPWYWKRFWRSKAVARMSDSAALLYKWLLDYQWENEHLEPPDAMRKLVPGRFATKWKKLWAEIQHPDGPCFEADEQGHFRNAALTHEREIAVVIRKAASAKASLGGKARARRLAEAELEERSKLNPERASSSAPSTTPSTPGAVLGASTSPDRTRPEEPYPTLPGGKGSIERVLGAIEQADPALPAHTGIAAALRAAGLEVEPDARIPDRGDGYSGVIDLRVHEPAAWIQLDRDEPREKSLEKLRAAPPGLRVVVLRSGARGRRSTLPPGIDAIVGLGEAKPAGPALVAPDVPAWKQNGFASEAEFRQANEFVKQPKPKLGELLAAKRNGAGSHA